MRNRKRNDEELRTAEADELRWYYGQAPGELSPPGIDYRPRIGSSEPPYARCYDQATLDAARRYATIQERIRLLPAIHQQVLKRAWASTSRVDPEVARVFGDDLKHLAPYVGVARRAHEKHETEIALDLWICLVARQRTPLVSRIRDRAERLLADCVRAYRLAGQARDRAEFESFVEGLEL